MKIEKRLAIIDLGSNSVRMNIIGLGEDSHYVLLDQAREKVRLSEGMGQENLIRREPLERLIATLALFRQLIDGYEIEEVYALATAAVRVAANQKEVLEEIRRRSGFSFQVISGEEEARLDWLGVVNTLTVENALIVDLGGGSTEIILMENRRLIESVSLPFGSVTLSENETVEEAKAKIDEALDQLSWLKGKEGWPVVGLGGTIRTLAKMERAQRRWPLFHVHGYRMYHAGIWLQLDRLARTPRGMINGLEGVSSDRADILQVGILPFERLFERLQPEFLDISVKGIREGFFFRRYFAGENWEPLEDVLDFSIWNYQKRYEVNRSHGEYLCGICRRLFDLTPHRFRASDRKILSVAARLHDIGMYIEYDNHHLHGFYLMIQSGIYGLRDEEMVEVALLIGWHRQRPLLFDLEKYCPLIPRERFQQLKDLALFLQVAERLDRSESQKVEEILEEEGVIRIRMKQGASSMLEQKAAQAGLRSMEEKFHCKILFDA